MTATEAGYVRRFTSARVLEHWMHILAFTTLVVTGLCQKFYSTGVFREFMSIAGGVDSVRVAHRVAASVFIALVVIHFFSAVVGVLLLKWSPSMLVLVRDIRNVVHNVKYYVGLKGAPARCGRYDYKQKFVYWLTLTGALLMMLSGLALWFPVATATVLPGQVIPAAKVVHSNHAMLIFLLIAIWHIYDSVFSPDVFPLDRSIFTGYISIERMRVEHPLELEEMQVRQGGASTGNEVTKRAADVNMEDGKPRA